MEKCYCDRCGEEVSPRNMKPDNFRPLIRCEETKNGTKFTGVKLVRYIGLMGVDISTFQPDICDNCFNDFLHWWNWRGGEENVDIVHNPISRGSNHIGDYTDDIGDYTDDSWWKTLL